MYQFFRAVVAPSNANTDIVMGVLPAHCMVLTPYLSVPTAFNSGASDAFVIGHATDDDAFGTSLSVSLIRTLVNFTGGAEVGYRASGKKVLLHYTSSGATPTLGSAIVILPFIIVPSL